MSDQQEALNKAMDELDQLEKSVQGEEESELDALTKALEDELGEDLSKSEDPTEADLYKGHKEPDGDEDGKDTDDDGDGEDDDNDDDDMDKSDMSDFDDELVKASEAYADLEKSVSEGINGVLAELDTLKMSLASQMNLNIKMAKVMAELVKSRKDDVAAMSEMAKSVGAAPVVPNKATFGLCGQEDSLQKSSSEIQDALLKAVQEGKVNSHYLSVFGTYKDVARLPQDVRQIIGC